MREPYDELVAGDRRGVASRDPSATVSAVLDTCPDYAGADLVEGLFERRGPAPPGELGHTDILPSSSPTAATL